MKTMIMSALLMTSAYAFACVAAEHPVSTFKLADGRTVLTDSKQRTLYTFDVDKGSESSCYEDCARAWPALIVAPDIKVSAPLGLTERRDKQMQLTVNGKPVYYFFGDSAPGNINGDGLSGVWHIILQ